MKMKLKLLTGAILAGLSLNSLASNQPPLTGNATNHFTITGMHCDGCAGGLTAELKETPGVASATVTFSNKLAVVSYDTNKITKAKLTAAIKEAGFTAKETNPPRAKP